MNNQILEFSETGERMLTATQYADRHSKAHRTVKRWIQDGRFPGATRDDAGRWLIPADAMPGDAVEPAPQTEVLPLDGHGAQVAPAAPAGAVERWQEAPAPAPLASLDAHPAFLDLDTAAGLLGVPASAIRRNAEYFGAQPFGKHGALVVPAGTVRKVAGL